MVSNAPFKWFFFLTKLAPFTTKRGFVAGTSAGLQAAGANVPDKPVEDSERCAVCGVTVGRLQVELGCPMT